MVTMVMNRDGVHIMIMITFDLYYVRVRWSTRPWSMLASQPAHPILSSPISPLPPLAPTARSTAASQSGHGPWHALGC